MGEQDPGGVVRAIIDASLYLVLATADETGRPWASPVYFATPGYTEFFWVSSPDATHSRNIAVRPQVGIVVFNSQVPLNSGQGVYMPAEAEQITGDGIERAIGVFSRRCVAHGEAPWTASDVQGTAPFRLYQATASGHSILANDGQADHRIVADLTSYRHMHAREGEE